MDSDSKHLDYEALGLKVGIEIHQQLDTHKLFCNDPSVLAEEVTGEFVRSLRPTQSELGEFDKAAIAEAAKKLKFKYQATNTTCLVEADEEPPHDANPEAVDIVLLVSSLMDAKIVDEVHFMRKTVIDGSNTSGFQRTGLIALNGAIKTSLGDVGIATIALEEDAARKIATEEGVVVYRLDRLGIPLIEIASEPDIKTPEHAKETAEKIGMLLRATKRVKRGLGTIRQDLNISISRGNRVELKGVQDLRGIPQIVENEVRRQLRLIEVKEELISRGAKLSDFDKIEIVDITRLFENTTSKIISSMLKKGGKVLGIRLPGFAKLMGAKTCSEGACRRLGPEFAQRAKTIGVKGILHSDELPQPEKGISGKDVENIKNALCVKENDGFVIVAEKEDVARKVLDLIIERAKQAFEGVPSEVRAVLPDCRSEYLRPMPGAARMYPETDVPPIRITKEHFEKIASNKPEMPHEKIARLVKEYGINEEQAKPLVSAGTDEIFEILSNRYKVPNIIAKTILNTIPELEKDGLEVSKITDEKLDDLFKVFSNKKFAKEGIPEVLKRMIVNNIDAEKAANELGFGEKEVGESLEKIIDDVVNERIEFVKQRGKAAIGPLMGPVMQKARGKFDGKTVNEMLTKKIERILEGKS